jgi:hypothetical protein
MINLTWEDIAEVLNYFLNDEKLEDKILEDLHNTARD